MDRERRLAARLARVQPEPLARWLAIEWVIARAAFVGDGMAGATAASSRGRAFGYAEASPLKLVVMAYPLLLVGDATVLYAVLPRVGLALHALVAALGVYGFVWLLGVHRTMLGRPHVVDAG